MAVNREKTHQWKADTAASVDMFNEWFMDRAPHPAHEAEAVAADAAQRSLMAIGRANPGTRLRDDAGASGGHFKTSVREV